MAASSKLSACLCVATRLIISTWWGCTSRERQMQARCIFKRDKVNKQSNNKFNTRGHPRSLWNKKTTPEALSSVAAFIFIMDSIIDGFKVSYVLWILLIITTSHLIFKGNATASLLWPPCVYIFNYRQGFSADYTYRFWTRLHQRAYKHAAWYCSPDHVMIHNTHIF